MSALGADIFYCLFLCLSVWLSLCLSDRQRDSQTDRTLSTYRQICVHLNTVLFFTKLLFHISFAFLYWKANFVQCVVRFRHTCYFSRISYALSKPFGPVAGNPSHKNNISVSICKLLFVNMWQQPIGKTRNRGLYNARSHMHTSLFAYSDIWTIALPAFRYWCSPIIAPRLIWHWSYGYRTVTSGLSCAISGALHAADHPRRWLSSFMTGYL